MTANAQKNLTLALVHLATAKEYFNYAKTESSATTKNFLNNQINRCNASEIEVLTKITTDEARERYRQHIKNGDIMQFENVIVTMLEMDQPKRDIFEKLVDAIKKGELIEFV
jgi:hypothetical protein